MSIDTHSVRMRNFGDELSRLTIGYVAGRPVVWSKPKGADVVGIGSVFERYAKEKSRGWVWGTGLRNEDVPTGGFDRGRILAVRGALTRSALRLPEDTVIGDPGLLVRDILKFPSVEKHGTVVIPHFSVYKSSMGRRELERYRVAGLKILNPARSPIAMCSLIQSAEHVITSSLHGLVVAHALRTPATLSEFAFTQESTFKYRDYFTALGSEPAPWSMGRLLDPTARGDARDVAADEIQKFDPLIDKIVRRLVNAGSRINEV